MIRALYPGTFDPITKGHLDIIERASKVFDELYIAIMHNPRKTETFSKDERKDMVYKCVSGLDNVKIIIAEGLTVTLANKLDINVVIRGIRAVADYEYELQQAITNMMLDEKIETIFFVSKPEYSFLSSSMAKEIAHLKGELNNFIPEPIMDDVIKKYNYNNQ